MYDLCSGECCELGVVDGVDFGIGWFCVYEKFDDGCMLFGGVCGLLVIDFECFLFWGYKLLLVVLELCVDGVECMLLVLGVDVVLVFGECGLSLVFVLLDYS